MDARSASVLLLVDPNLATLVQQAQDALTPQNIYMAVYQGLRSAAQQDADYAEGRTAPGKICTNARAGHSNHNYGLAVDVVPYLVGDTGDFNWEVDTPQFQTMVEALKDQGLVYGGDWQHFPDNDHFQMPTIPPSPNADMIADFPLGLATIWNNAASGKYMEAV